MDQRCSGCGDDYKFLTPETTLQRCSGCKRVYYCSTECQNNHWVYHIFDCKPHSEINTAYYLARAVYEDLIPVDPQTCRDYGFDCTSTERETTMLFGLYVGMSTNLAATCAIFFIVHTGLIKLFDIPARTVHRWRIRGVLVDEIMDIFFQLPEDARGLYFPWFLENVHVVALAGQPLVPGEAARLAARVAVAVVRAWRFTGGGVRDSVEEIEAAIAHRPVEERDCRHLYALLLYEVQPSRSTDLWVNLGFPLCKSREEEQELRRLYQKLIRLCTFEEFCDAYRTHRLSNLFDDKGLRVNNRVHFQNILQANRISSVWYLKQAVAQEDFTEAESNIVPAALVDYGFANCRNDSEKQGLRKAYKDFFDSPHHEKWFSLIRANEI